jgi:tol-pal system protein YbgF
MRNTLFGLLVIGFLASPALAQEQNLRPLLDRLDRVERDLNQVQRQVYRNEVGGGGAPVVPGSAESGSAALNLEIRVGQLEEQMRKLTGQLEEIQYGIGQVTAKLDKTQADNEIRFQQLESGQNAAPPGKSGARPNGGAGTPDQPASVGGTLTPPGDRKPAEPQAAPAGTGLPAGSTQDQYNYAFGLLRQNDYKTAEAAFKAFLQKHPNDPLSGNAQYWLGETYFVRADYQAAAAAFAEGLQKFPQSAKASDNLLKLGMSLGNIGRKDDACFALAKLERDFPQMPQGIRDRETHEKQKLGCRA